MKCAPLRCKNLLKNATSTKTKNLMCGEKDNKNAYSESERDAGEKVEKIEQTGEKRSKTEIIKTYNGTNAWEEVLVGVVGPECFAPILKLPPPPAGVSARSGRAFRRFPGISAQIIEKRYEKHHLMVIEHCFPLFAAPAVPPSRLAPSAAPRGPPRPCLCCCYDPGHVAAPIWSRNTTGGAAPPLFPHCFLYFFPCFWACLV